jgi:endoglucanase
MKKRLLLFITVIMSGLQAMALSTTDFGSNNYIETWGRLKLVTTANSGTNKVQLADKDGKAVQLRGWTTHGYQWASVRLYFDQKNDFEGMKKLGANVVRLTCYVSKTSDGVNQSAWNSTKTWVKNAITWCAELGLYAIVDYHVLTPGNPNDYLNDAGWEKADAFFTDISAYVKQNGYRHVLYEICNEPNGSSATWASIRTYANAILPVIAANDPDAVVIVGTPNWSQYLSNANSSKLTHSTLQIMYTFHFYACSHSSLLTSQFTDAILKSIPVFATEWSDTENTGRGSCGTPPTTAATNFINRCNNTATQRVSWTAWSWSPIETESGEDRTSSAWNRGTPSNGTGYTVNNLSPTGKMVYDELQKNHINYDGTGGGGTNPPAAVVEFTFENDALNKQYAAMYPWGSATPATVAQVKANPASTAGNTKSLEFAPENWNTAVVFDVTLPAGKKWSDVTGISVDVYTATAGNGDQNLYKNFMIGINSYVQNSTAIETAHTTDNIPIASAGGWKTTVIPAEFLNGKLTINGALTTFTLYLGVNVGSGVTYFLDNIKILVQNTPTSIPLVSSGNATMQIYPNPAKDGNFNVKLPNSETAAFTVVNLQGQTVYTTTINNGFASINTNLGTGVYIVSVRSESGLRTERLVVK